MNSFLKRLLPPQCPETTPLTHPETGNPPLEYDNCREILRFMGRVGASCALMSKAEIDASCQMVRWLGLPSHHDHQKNWDTLKALYHIMRLNDREGSILDAGSSGDSAILKWLNLMGFTKLYACDIRAKTGKQKYACRNIEFSVQDLTHTNYPDNFFMAVSCISVIEHGIDLPAYVHEMQRILRPGGVLLVSTDYWSSPVDCTGIYPYGQSMGEMKVFQPQEIHEFIHMAEASGLQVCGALDLQTRERAVRWDRVDREYTFAFFALQKPPMAPRVA
jgi:SAM-dependent methyltransferase